jgi:hypothetical protein
MIECIYTVDPADEQVYIETCRKCGNVHHVITQKDNYPEYHADVHVICDCGKRVHFRLPVN